MSNGRWSSPFPAAESRSRPAWHGCLDAPLDVIVVRKIGHPEAPEFGLGAIAEGGEPVFDDAVLAEAGLSVADLAAVVARERAELARRVGVYRGARDARDASRRPAGREARRARWRSWSTTGWRPG